MKRIIALLLALAMLFALTACGSSENSKAESSASTASKEESSAASDEAAGKKANDDVVGTYKLSSMSGDDTSPEDLELMESMGLRCLLVLEADGTGSLDMYGEVESITWDDDHIYSDGDPADYSFRWGELTISDDDISMTFVKLTEEEIAALNDPASAPASASTVAGFYEVSSMSVGDATMGVNSLAEQDITPNNTYVFLEDDTSGYISLFDGVEMPLTLDTKFMVVNGEAISYTLENDTISITVERDDDEVGLTFVRTGDTRPETLAGAPAPDDGQAKPSIEPTTPGPAAPVEGASVEPVSHDFKESHLDILSAEFFTDSDGKDSIRIYYDYTNTSAEPECAFIAYTLEATQDDYELVTTYALDDVPEGDNYLLDVRPGVTIRCCEEYNFKSTGGPVIITFSEFLGDDSVSMQFDPQNLPGRPADDWTITPIKEPDWVNGLPAEADHEDIHIKITKSEPAKNYNGDPLTRIYFEFTNNTGEATSFIGATDFRVMQDGIELDYTYTFDVPEEDNDTVDVAPGETITVARCYYNRTDSPMTVEFYDFLSDEVYAGTVIPAAN